MVEGLGGQRGRGDERGEKKEEGRRDKENGGSPDGVVAVRAFHWLSSLMGSNQACPIISQTKLIG